MSQYTVMLNGEENMIIKKIGKLMSTIMAVIMLVTVTVPAFAAEEAETVCKHDQGNYYKYTKAPTCTKSGTRDLFCWVCDELLEKDEWVPATGHGFLRAEIIKASTATEKGILRETCSECGEKIRDIKLENNPEECYHEDRGYYNDIYPTCTEDGREPDSICRQCGKMLKTGNVQKAFEHKYDQYSLIKKIDPTCTKEGKKVFRCYKCFATKEETIPVTGHKHKELRDKKDATCKEEGYTGNIYCKDCNEIVSLGTVIAKTSVHSWDAGVVTKQPTITEEGIKTYTCSVCSETKIEKIAKLLDDKKEDIKIPDNKKDTTTIVIPSKPSQKIVEKVGTNFVVAGNTYKITKSSAEVSFVQAKKNVKSIAIPDIIKSNGVTYKVTSIETKAIKNNKKLKNITIGKNVRTVRKNAVFKCPALKTVNIKSTLLTKKTASKKGFKSVNKKLVIKVPKKVKKLYTKIFKGLKIK